MARQPESPAPRRLRARLYEVVESSSPDDWRARLFDGAMIVLILANIVAVIVETVDVVAQRFDTLFTAFEVFSVAVFTVEYLIRVWVSVEDRLAERSHALTGRLRYMLSLPALIDLAAILPFYLSFLIAVDLRFLRVLRLLRLLKLTRYSPALETFGAVLYSQRRSLLASGFVMFSMLLFAASVIYLLERDVQPQAFGSIPHAMWWAMATLSTVGYGDVTPSTPVGQLFGGLVMVIGIGMFALPTGILASGFATELKKRDFVVSWGLVAKVPLFANLDAAGISEIAQALHPKLVPARYTIVRRGEMANDMYFIVSGEVEVDAPSGLFHLATGDFFGEIALLAHRERTATVTALTDCHLLVLNKRDFMYLLDGHPDLKATVEAAMAERLAQLDAVSGDGQDS
jgi:voltage-gated potassium channel